MTDRIRFYNTKDRRVEEFSSLHDGEARIYSCGPTVYHYQHLGNMRAAVFADTLHRTLSYAGYAVKHVINITDVGHLTSDADQGEDKLEKGAKREGKTAWEVASFYTDAYFKDLKSLNISLSEYLFPRATDHIKEQIELVRSLEEKGYTYTIADGVYFDTAKFHKYGEFAHLDLKGLQAGARVEENTEKRNPTDFALWKFSPHPPAGGEARQMEWDSPWGKGFPGWHAECSAMAMKYLGEHFDIHTGGIDHIPVHHTNEIAQSECATGKPYVNFWLHNNFLNDASGKMAKSNGEFLRLQSVIDRGIPALSFRYYLLTVHYRKEIEFSFEALEAAGTAYEKLVSFCKENSGKNGSSIPSYRDEFKQALYEDLNTPQAIAVLWNMLKSDASKDDKYATLIEMDTVLGLGLSSIKKEQIILSAAMKELLQAREDARAAKNFAESDRLRDEISKLGFTVKDTSEGQILTQ